MRKEQHPYMTTKDYDMIFVPYFVSESGLILEVKKIGGIPTLTERAKAIELISMHLARGRHP